jgi:serine/threonine-protein kinase
MRRGLAGDAAVSDHTSALATKANERQRRGWWLIGLIITLTALAAGTGLYFGVGPGSKTTIPTTIAGMTQEKATQALEKLGLQVESKTGTTDSPTVPVGQVAKTDPPLGSQVAHGAAVKLLLSTGPKPLPLPAFAGMTEDQATQAIKDAPFTLKDTIRQFDASVAKGLVIDALGADNASILAATEYGERQPITLVVSSGGLPDVGGKSIDEATQILAGVNVTASPGRKDFSDYAEGTVAGIDPENGRVFREGESVSLVISKGPDLVEVPDVIGDNIAAAKAELEGLGFVVQVNTDIQPIFWSFPPAKVTDQTPGGGEKLKRGSKVIIEG